MVRSVTSSVVTEVTMGRPEARLVHSFVESTASTVRHQLRGAESDDEGAQQSPTNFHSTLPGSSLFGEALMEKAGEVASQKRHRSLEEAMIKSVKGTKGSKSSSKRSAPSGGQQKQDGGKNRKRGKKSQPKSSG